MVRRITSCIGFDNDNLVWLQARPEGMSEWINCIIKIYREDDKVRKVIGNNVVTPELEAERRRLLESNLTELARKDIEDAILIRAYLLDNAHIMYMAKTQRKFTKKDLCKIKDEIFFSKYNADVTVVTIRKVLKEELMKFDVSTYEQERGIIKKV